MFSCFAMPSKACHEQLNIITEELKKTTYAYLNDKDNLNLVAKFECDVLEVIQKILDEKLPSNSLLSAITLAGMTADKKALGLSVTSCLWLTGTQVQSDSVEWKLLGKMVSDIDKSGMIDKHLLRTSLELKLLQEAGIINDADKTHKLIIKLNTNLVYRQQKYNLFREETEGYSKLVVVLSGGVEEAGEGDAAAVASFVKTVISLIGHFDLDPNRVLDIVLDVFEHQPLNPCFIPLLKQFQSKYLAHILGFKFTHYSVQGYSSCAKSPKEEPSHAAEDKSFKVTEKDIMEEKSSAAAPESLYYLTAVLIMNNLVRLDDLLPYLSPSFESTAAVLREQASLQLKELKSFGVVSLSGKGSAPLRSSGSSSNPPPPAYPPPTGDDGDNKKIELTDDTSDPSLLEKNLDLSLTLFQELTTNNPVFAGENSTLSKEEATAVVDSSQLVGLAAALLTVRGWEQAQALVAMVLGGDGTETEALDWSVLLRHSEKLRRALGLLIEWSSDLVFLGLSKKSKKPPAASLLNAPDMPQTQFSQVRSLKDFPVEVSPLLSTLGHHIGHNSALIERVARISTACLEETLHQFNKAKVEKALLKSQSPIKDESDGAENANSKTQETGNSETEELIELLNPVLSLYSFVLLPGLSICTTNSESVNRAFWAGLKSMPYAVRFNLYDQWRGVGLGKEGLQQDNNSEYGTKPNDVLLAEATALQKARAELKRLAKENTKQIGRNLAYINDCCPMVVSSHILSQVEAFDNLIPFVVDALRFSTSLSHDCMAYCLVHQLKKGSQQDKLKKGDTHYSQWFAAISRFTATFFWRYPTTQLRPLILHLLRQLSEGEVLDLLVLKDLLGIMGGCETLLEVSPVQLEGLSGGRALRAKVMGGHAVNSVAGNAGGSGSEVGSSAGKGILSGGSSKEASLALRNELISSNAAMPLLLLIAQVRSNILFSEVDSDGGSHNNLKLISHLFDTAQDVLMQFTDFLVTGGNSAGSGTSGTRHLESVASMIPSFKEMIEDLSLALPIVFQLVRPIMRAALQASADPGSADIPEALKRWHPYSPDLLALLETHVQPKELWNFITPKMYMVFWSLGLCDIRAPVQRYDLEIKRVKDRYSELDSKKLGPSGPGSTMSSSEWKKLNEQRHAGCKQLLSTITHLQEEKVGQQRHVGSIKEMLASQVKEFFKPLSESEEISMEVDDVQNPLEPTDEDSNLKNLCPRLSKEEAHTRDIIEVVMQHLIYPRLLLSPLDAVFCSQFVLLLHDLQTPLFSSLHCFNSLLRHGAALIFSTTETEASFLGFALVDLLKSLNKWDTSASTFGKEAKGKSGFVVSPLALTELIAKSSKTPTAAPGGKAAVEEEKSGEKDKEEVKKEGTAVEEQGPADGKIVVVSITHSQYQEVYQAWHTALFRTLRAGLAGGSKKEYMYIRSAMMLMSKLSPIYPTKPKEGLQLLKDIETLQKQEVDRGDLQTMARSLGAILKKESRVWLGSKAPSSSQQKDNNGSSRNTSSRSDPDKSTTRESSSNRGDQDRRRSRSGSRQTNGSTSNNVAPLRTADSYASSRDRGGPSRTERLTKDSSRERSGSQQVGSKRKESSSGSLNQQGGKEDSGGRRTNGSSATPSSPTDTQPPSKISRTSGGGGKGGKERDRDRERDGSTKGSQQTEMPPPSEIKSGKDSKGKREGSEAGKREVKPSGKGDKEGDSGGKKPERGDTNSSKSSNGGREKDGNSGSGGGGRNKRSASDASATGKKNSKQDHTASQGKDSNDHGQAPVVKKARRDGPGGQRSSGGNGNSDGRKGEGSSSSGGGEPPQLTVPMQPQHQQGSGKSEGSQSESRHGAGGARGLPSRGGPPVNHGGPRVVNRSNFGGGGPGVPQSQAHGYHRNAQMAPPPSHLNPFENNAMGDQRGNRHPGRGNYMKRDNGRR